jgi:transposase-like protein
MEPDVTPGRRAFPANLLEFQRMFPDEAACAEYLSTVRWPDGFLCPTCGAQSEPKRVATRPAIRRCRPCGAETSLTAGTIMHRTRLPLQVWFWAAYLASTQTPGMSALQLQRQLGIPRYETAFQLLHKLRAGMLRPDQDRIGKDHPVEVDEAYVGGKTRGRGRGVTDKTIVAAAVEVRDGGEGEFGVYAGRLRLRVVGSRAGAPLTKFVVDSVEPGASVVTDGWVGYDDLRGLGYKHRAVVVSGNVAARTAEALPMVHLVFSNLKSWILGTHHGVSEKHLQAYLNEFVFRFNRRFYPMTAFSSVLGIAARSDAPSYEGLYDGTWSHPEGPRERS